MAVIAELSRILRNKTGAYGATGGPLHAQRPLINWAAKSRAARWAVAQRDRHFETHTRVPRVACSSLSDSTLFYESLCTDRPSDTMCTT